jgi:hypothetical protein
MDQAKRWTFSYSRVLVLSVLLGNSFNIFELPYNPQRTIVQRLLIHRWTKRVARRALDGGPSDSVGRNEVMDDGPSDSVGRVFISCHTPDPILAFL